MLEDNPQMGFKFENDTNAYPIVKSFRVLIWDSCNKEYVAASEAVTLKYFGDDPDFKGNDALFGRAVFTNKVIDFSGIRATNEHFGLEPNFSLPTLSLIHI